MGTGIPGDRAAQGVSGVERESVHGAGVSDVLQDSVSRFNVPHECHTI